MRPGGVAFVPIANIPTAKRLLLVPQGVDDGKGDGETGAEDPGKIPHRRRFLWLVAARAVFANIGQHDPAAQHPINECRIGQDNRQKD
jgi:hypothetical protein